MGYDKEQFEECLSLEQATHVYFNGVLHVIADKIVGGPRCTAETDELGFLICHFYASHKNGDHDYAYYYAKEADKDVGKLVLLKQKIVIQLDEATGSVVDSSGGTIVQVYFSFYGSNGKLLERIAYDNKLSYVKERALWLAEQIVNGKKDE